jgi:hypothetical protein
MIITKQAVLNHRDRQTERTVLGFLSAPLALLLGMGFVIAA